MSTALQSHQLAKRVQIDEIWSFVGSKQKHVTPEIAEKRVAGDVWTFVAIERQNLTMRMSVRRFTRLTNVFSKKIENHMHSVALYYMYYNFARVHQTLRVTPAMEADQSACVVNSRNSLVDGTRHQFGSVGTQCLFMLCQDL